MTRHLLLRALCAVALLLLAGIASAAEPLTVFAAASLKESLDAAALAFERDTGTPVRVSYAASSALARQIEQGAPADVFVSADRDWMDYLQDRGRIDPRSRRDLLGNTLVLIAPTVGDTTPIVLRPGIDLGPRLRGGRLAVALTASVPAGKYARAALVSLNAWTPVATQLAESENVRAALMLVARGEAPLGIVYGSDAQAEPAVRVVAVFPADSHPPIVYPAARVAASRHLAADAFVRWLQGRTAGAIFRRHGFTLR